MKGATPDLTRAQKCGRWWPLKCHGAAAKCRINRTFDRKPRCSFVSYGVRLLPEGLFKLDFNELTDTGRALLNARLMHRIFCPITHMGHFTEQSYAEYKVSTPFVLL